jgi:hypothetical protein
MKILACECGGGAREGSSVKGALHRLHDNMKGFFHARAPCTCNTILGTALVTFALLVGRRILNRVIDEISLLI